MKGDSAMTAVKTAAAAVTALVVSSLFSAGTTSEPTFVFLRPETSSFWRTAFDSEITVPVDFPEGSDTATLRVSGLGYEREYADITAADLGENGFTFTLPQAVKKHCIFPKSAHQLKYMKKSSTEKIPIKYPSKC